jgi:NAD(P)H-hydrate epimerase
VPSAAELKKADVIIDAIFGIGLTRDIGGRFRQVIEEINQHAKRVVSLDVPSGLDATTGKIHGVCVKADRTITFHLMKKGLLNRNEKNVAGNVAAVHIGF